jgi:hypothetical protein
MTTAHGAVSGLDRRCPKLPSGGLKVSLRYLHLMLSLASKLSGTYRSVFSWRILLAGNIFGKDLRQNPTVLRNFETI